ncbi:MAG: ABC transporter permease, partial [Bacteroidia bacterium]
MRNIALVTGREYQSRVRKKSFVVMTLLGPFLLAAFYGAIIWLAISDTQSSEPKNIHVLDESGLFQKGIDGSANIRYTVNPEGADSSAYDGTLLIPAEFSIDKPEGARFLSNSSLNIVEQQTMESHLETAIKEQKLIRAGLRKETLDSLETDVNIRAAIISGGEIKEDDSSVNAGAGFVGAFFIYIFIFLYGVQVMKGVAEEKSNRIVEVIISSVKPFDLMMGKIIGIALVGLTQVFIWIGLSTVLIAIITPIIASTGMNPEDTAALVEGTSGGVAPGMGMLGALFQLDFTTL